MFVFKWLTIIVMIAVSWMSVVSSASASLTDSGFDLSQISFSDFDGIEQAGQISSEWNRQAGYDVGRIWEAGDQIEDVLQLGDLQSDFGAEKLTLQQIGDTLAQDLSLSSLGDFPLLSNQSLQNLTENIDYLSEFRVGEVAPIQALLEQQVGLDFADTEIGALIEQVPEYGDLKLTDLGDSLNSFSISDIPNADLTRFDSLSGFENSQLSDIPGLDELPLANFPNGIGTIGGITARIDMIYGTEEDHRTNTISGSLQAGFNVACSEEGQLVSPPDQCAYIELDDLEDEGRELQGDFEGKQWISGKYHEVEGGFGILKNVPSALGYSTGYEPTGRHPFGKAFKVVIWQPNETTDEVNAKLFFRWCTTVVGVRTCTPYNQFSVPFPQTYRVNSQIFVGMLDGEGGATAVPGTQQNSYNRTTFGNPSLPPRVAPCTGEVVAGINLDALGDALALIESGGQGYDAIGVYTCYNSTCGRALGRYQTMTYLPEVQAQVASIPGGQAWLNKIENGYQPTVAEVQQYYTPELQEEAFQAEINQLFAQAQTQIDPRTGEAFTGNRLIERVAQMWFGGPGAPIDGGASDALGRLSLYDYGVEARQNYLAQGGQPSNDCANASGGLTGKGGQPTGSYTNPVGQYPITSDFGSRNIGCNRSKFHPAVDLGTPIGTPVGAADGGVVQFSACGVSGYGCTVVVDHGNGRKTRYSHLANVGVRQGQAVAKGEQIARSGNTDGSTSVSTGPHLDFGIYHNDTTGAGQLPIKGNAVNPTQYIQF